MSKWNSASLRPDFGASNSLNSRNSFLRTPSNKKPLNLCKPRAPSPASQASPRQYPARWKWKHSKKKSKSFASNWNHYSRNLPQRLPPCLRQLRPPRYSRLLPPLALRHKPKRHAKHLRSRQPYLPNLPRVSLPVLLESLQCRRRNARTVILSNTNPFPNRRFVSTVKAVKGPLLGALPAQSLCQAAEFAPKLCESPSLLLRCCLRRRVPLGICIGSLGFRS